MLHGYAFLYNSSKTNHSFYFAKTTFLKNQKKVTQKKLGSPGGKAPWLADCIKMRSFAAHHKLYPFPPNEC